MAMIGPPEGPKTKRSSDTTPARFRATVTLKSGSNFMRKRSIDTVGAMESCPRREVIGRAATQQALLVFVRRFRFAAVLTNVDDKISDWR
jgi:hypothetical protein